MRRAILSASPLTLLLLSAVAVAGQKNIADTEPRTPADEAKLLHLPPGFEVQLVASEPDIHKPINMDFDDRGRLWVTQTIEYPFPEKDGKLKGQDAVKVLEDFGPDGKAHKITTFADDLDIPIGVLPLCPPSRRTPSSTASRASGACATPTATAGPTSAPSSTRNTVTRTRTG